METRLSGTDPALAHGLDEVRRSAGLSYRELAKRANCPASTLNDALCGRRFPKLDTVLAVARACGADPDEWRARWVAADRRRREVGATSSPAPEGADLFTGRTAILDELADRLAGESLVVISGTAGVGKTALAVRLGHRLAWAFPDGQLFLDLHGFTPGAAPLSPVRALGQLLIGDGVAPADLPADESGRSALFRERIRGRRMLLVFDDARAESDVRPLLPAEPGCAVLVTSRGAMTGLADADSDAAYVHRLDVLEQAEAIALLVRVIGAERVRREHTAAVDLVQLCARLPLALRVVAAHLAIRPAASLSDLVERFRVENRWDVLRIPDDPSATVRVAFELSYQALGDSARRLYRLLGLVPADDSAPEAIAALAGLEPAKVERPLTELFGAHLVDENPPGRYRMHDLLRADAAERCGGVDDEPTRSAAIERLLGWYLSHADRADRSFAPNRRRPDLAGLLPDPDLRLTDFDDPESGLAWYDAELAGLVPAIRAAIDHGFSERAWKLAATAWGYFDIRKPWDEWIATYELGLVAAERLGDAYGRAWCLNNLGAAYYDLREYDRAIELFEQAASIRTEIGDVRGHAISLGNLGNAYQRSGRFAEAIVCLREDLAATRELGDQNGMAISLNNLGDAYRNHGDLDAAADCLRQALRIRRELDDSYGEALTLGSLGEVCHDRGSYDRGQYDEAESYYEAALAICRPRGDQWLAAVLLDDLARTRVAVGRTDSAEQCWREALRLFERIQDPRAADVRSELDGLRPARAGDVSPVVPGGHGP